MTISNNNLDLEERLLEKIKIIYKNAHGHDATEHQLVEFIRDTIKPLIAKIEELKTND